MTIAVAECANLTGVRLIRMPQFSDSNGDLIVMEGEKHVPFAIARVFVVRAQCDAIRGQHAHRECTQLLTCPTGVIEVVCDDGREQQQYLLDRPDEVLLVPPGIWARQTYRASGSVLTVLCDRPYRESDYIRSYADFLAFKGVRPKA